MVALQIILTILSIAWNFWRYHYNWGPPKYGTVKGWMSADEARRFLSASLSAAAAFFTFAATVNSTAVWVLCTLGAGLTAAANMFTRLRDGDGKPAIVYPSGEVTGVSESK